MTERDSILDFLIFVAVLALVVMAVAAAQS